MRLPLVLASCAALAFAAGLAPVASAAVPVSCGASLYVWNLDYDCHVQYVGADGTVTWCPDPYACRNVHVISCYFDLTPPYYCVSG